jgi:hypothetical protein
MRVRCKYNKPSQITEPEYQEYLAQSVNVEEIYYVPGREYVVFGLSFSKRSGLPSYFLCEGVDDDYPTSKWAPFFELLDASIPDNWIVIPDEYTYIVPSAWASIPRFYERLLDADPEAEALWRKIRTETLTTAQHPFVY